MDIKQKNTTNENKYFLESNFSGVNRLFDLLYRNKDNKDKRFKSWRYYLTKGVIKNYNVIVNGKGFYNQPINSDIKRYKEIRKLTTGQSEDHTTRCLLGYEYIKIHYRLIAVDLSRQKDLGDGLKAIQQIEFIEQLKNLDDNGKGADSGNYQSIFALIALTILEKIKETRLEFSKGSVKVL